MYLPSSVNKNGTSTVLCFKEKTALGEFNASAVPWEIKILLRGSKSLLHFFLSSLGAIFLNERYDLKGKTNNPPELTYARTYVHSTHLLLCTATFRDA